VQLLTLDTTAAEMRLGVYNPVEKRRLTTEVGEEFIILSGD